MQKNRCRFYPGGWAFIDLHAVSLRNSEKDLSTSLYPATRNANYKVNREITPEKITTTYNNFYEFGSHKNIWRAAQRLQIRPWEVTIDGLVEKEIKVDIDTLLKKMQLEERIYRHRCVEAWAITVPWTGFPMRALLDYARPRAGAKYVVMEAFEDQEIAPGQRQFWYPWPYREAVTIEEAANELSMIGTGAYGKPMAKQNGAPLRLIVPWKYGFKQSNRSSVSTLLKIDHSVFGRKYRERNTGFGQM